LAETRLSDIVADYAAEGDPRSYAASCAFVARHQRPQKPRAPQTPKQNGKDSK
jgi:hypothetical protein